MIKKTLFTAAFFLIVSSVFGGKVSAYESHFGYTVNGSSVTVFVTDGGDSDHRLSLDGGNTYFNAKMPFTFSYLPDGIYQLRVMYGDGELSEVKTAVVGSSGIPRGNEIYLFAAGFAEETLGGGEIYIRIRNYTADRTYLISSDSGRTWFPAAGEETVLRGFHAGEHSIIVRCAQEPHLASRELSVAVPVRRVSERVILKAPLVRQLPELPTGCEVTSLAMAINYHGIKISKTVLADYFLEKGEYRAADYRKVFVGDPREVKAYGCYAPVIVNCAEKFFATVSARSFAVTDLTGCPPGALYGYVDMGFPVIVWISNKMLPTVEGPTWTDAESGETVTWVGNEHCVLLTGYDMTKGVVYVNDPLYGIVPFKMDDFEVRFCELEQQAIVISEITEKQ